MPRVARFASSLAPFAGRRIDLALWLLLLGAGLLAVLAPQWVEAHSPPCLFTLLFGRECWGCGMTRACLALLQGHWSVAWSLNPRAGLVLPLLVVVFARFTRRLFGVQ
jgi:hypothetical protein